MNNDLTTFTKEKLNIKINQNKGLPFAQYAGLGIRKNPKRAQLIVSTVLGKHIPVKPQKILEIGNLIGEKVQQKIESEYDGPLDESSLTIGYCETATGLGHTVASFLKVPYIHTTRRKHPLLPVAIEFKEPHSHAADHIIQPDPNIISMDRTGPIILVDDELSTGTTALNTIQKIHDQNPRPVYIIATIVDARTETQKVAFQVRVQEMKINVHVVSLIEADLETPDNVLSLAQKIVQDENNISSKKETETSTKIKIYESLWPENFPTTARHGMTWENTKKLQKQAEHVSLALMPNLQTKGSVLVVGTEELMYLPTQIANFLSQHLPQAKIFNQSTTRSPVYPQNIEGYPIRQTLTFEAPDEPSRKSLLHNLFDPRYTSNSNPWLQQKHTDIVVVADTPPENCESLIDVLKPYTSHTIHLVSIPDLHVKRKNFIE